MMAVPDWLLPRLETPRIIHRSHMHRWMLFVDGENFTIRGQELAKQEGVELAAGRFHMRDVFVWIPGLEVLEGDVFDESVEGIRAYYYTSVRGDDPMIQQVREQLRALSFDPQVFKRDPSRGRSKGVDIALTKDMLSHAFLGNYETAVLVAGDGDYVPLIQEVKRLGKRVTVAFFEKYGLNAELRLVADEFCALEDKFLNGWRTTK